MGKLIRQYTDVPKIQRNGIRARIKNAIEKYDFDSVRLVANRMFDEIKEEQDLIKEIKRKEEELKNLKRMKNGE